MDVATGVSRRGWTRAGCILWLACILAEVGVAAAAGTQTLGQMARAQGWDPDAPSVAGHLNMDRRIPRDFPVPAQGHDLSASNAVPAVGVEGVTAEQAGPFYREIFAQRNWSIRKETRLPGYIDFVACPPSGRCVNLSASSPNGIAGPPGLKMLFFDPKADR